MKLSEIEPLIKLLKATGQTKIFIEMRTGMTSHFIESTDGSRSGMCNFNGQNWVLFDLNKLEDNK